MRELAKSMIGLSWAMSVFSAQQLGKLVTGSQEAIDAAIAEVDDVSKFVQSRLSEAMIQQFRAGDEWQRRIVDLAFTTGAPLQVLDPRPLTRLLDGRALVDAIDPGQMIKSGIDLVQQTADAVRRRAPAVPAAAPTIN